MHSAVHLTAEPAGWGLGGSNFKFQLSHITFMDVNCEIISTTILLLLIQEGQLSATGESIVTSSLVNHLDN